MKNLIKSIAIAMITFSASSCYTVAKVDFCHPARGSSFVKQVGGKKWSNPVVAKPRSANKYASR